MCRCGFCCRLQLRRRSRRTALTFLIILTAAIATSVMLTLGRKGSLLETKSAQERSLGQPTVRSVTSSAERFRPSTSISAVQVIPRRDLIRNTTTYHKSVTGIPKESAVAGTNTTARNQTTKPTCKDDCVRLRDLFSSWPANKPKAVIYFLIEKSSLKLLQKSLSALDRFFNNKFQYPIVIFYEPDKNFPDYHLKVLSMTNSSRVFMQKITFELPSFLTKTVPKEIRGKNRVYGIGYRHMCRFHAKLVYEQPIMLLPGIEYAWRLDHDSFITRPIEYNIFDHMRQRQLIYGFVKIYRELPLWIVGLWDVARKYIQENQIRPTFFRKWPKTYMYYNNFEVSKLSLWLSPEYQQFIEHIDQNGGIYYHRWGDAPIKSIAVSMFVQRDKTYNFKDVGYIHQFFRRP